MWSAAPAVVKSSSRYARRLSSVDSTPTSAKRLAMVPELSSAARIPLPPATSPLAVVSSSVISLLPVRLLQTPVYTRAGPRRCVVSRGRPAADSDAPRRGRRDDAPMFTELHPDAVAHPFETLKVGDAMHPGVVSCPPETSLPA